MKLKLWKKRAHIGKVTSTKPKTCMGPTLVKRSALCHVVSLTLFKAPILQQCLKNINIYSANLCLSNPIFCVSWLFTDLYPTASLCIFTLQEPLTNRRLTPKRALFKHRITQTLLIHSCGAERALNLSEAVFLLLDTPSPPQVGHL